MDGQMYDGLSDSHISIMVAGVFAFKFTNIT